MSEWPQERIDGLRRVAEAVGAVTKWSPRWINATAAFEEVAHPAAVLSLLDELERVRMERDALTEGLRNGRLLLNVMHPENRQDA